MALPPSWALSAANVVRYAGLRSEQPMRTLASRSEPLSARIDRLRSAWQAAPMSDFGYAERLADECFDTACYEADCDDVNNELATAFLELGTALAQQNRQVFAFPDIDLSYSLTTTEARFLAQELQELQTRLQHQERLSEIYTQGLTDTFSSLLYGLPVDAIASASSQFSVPLYDLLDVRELINFFLTRFLRDLEPETPDHVAALAFSGTREQLWDNVLSVSKMTPDQLEMAPHKLRWPEDVHVSPPQLVHAYLSNTPLAAFAGTELPFALPYAVRFEHCHIVGGSGHGKTQLLQQLIHGDLVASQTDGRSVVVIDSQGDLIRTIAQLDVFDPGAPGSLAERFMLIDPNDIAFPVALNMFDVHLDRIHSFPALEREKILNGTIELYEYIFGALLGAELTQKQGLIFRYLARLLMVIPGATIHTLRELLEHGERFKDHFVRLDGSARHFFESEYLSPAFKATKTQALRRLWGVLANPTFERMFSHRENKVDLFAAMNAGKIILINTAKDLLKQEGCEIFGRFFIAMIAQAALQRAAIPAAERPDTFVYIDEAHDYFDENIEHLLNQARKFRVGLTLAHQNLDQLSAGLRASMMASTSIKLVGGLSNKDAKTFAPDMRTTPDFLQSMRKSETRTTFAGYIRNQTETALQLSVPLGFVNAQPQLDAGVYDDLLRVNRAAYCSPLEEVRYETARPETIAPVQVAEPAVTDHRQLQQQLKERAQAQNLAAAMEVPVLDGTGSVDVVIDTGSHAIACEISATTRVQHELQNIEKCLAAGFSEVWMIADNPAHLEDLNATISSALSAAELEQVRFLSPEAALNAITSLKVPAATKNNRAFGYDIEVVSHTPTADEQQRRRDSLNQLFASQSSESAR